MQRLNDLIHNPHFSALAGVVVGVVLVLALKSSPSKPVNVDVARADWVTGCVSKMAGGSYPRPQQLKDCTDTALILMPLVNQSATDGVKVASALPRDEASVSK